MQAGTGRPSLSRKDLTARQREVLGLLARGKTNGEIATTLGISLDGAKWHVSGILERLDVATREEAAAWWMAEGRAGTRLGRVLRGLVDGAAMRWIAGGVLTGMAVGVTIVLIASRGPGPDAPVSPDAEPSAPAVAATAGTLTISSPLAGGSPSVDCGVGTFAYTIRERAISLCLPDGWRVTDKEEAAGLFFRAEKPNEPKLAFELSIVTRLAGQRREDFEPPCARREFSVQIFGYEGTQCESSSEDPDWLLFGDPTLSWKSVQFVELVDYWVIVTSFGPATTTDESEISRQKASAGAIIKSARHNGLHLGIASPGTPTATLVTGWPDIECPAEATEHQVSTRHISFCAPDGWIVNQQEWDPDSGTPAGFWAINVTVRHPQDPALGFSFVLISKRSSATYGHVGQCEARTSDTLFGVTVERCDATYLDTNGTPFYPVYSWTTRMAGETAEYWLSAEAWGPAALTVSAEIEAQRDTILSYLATFAHHSLSRIDP